MKQLFILCVSVLCSLNLLAQSPEIAIKSLEYLNQEFHLNLEKENELIFVKIDTFEYISFQFVSVGELKDLKKIKWKYELRELKANKYEFNLRISSEYIGSFELKEENGKYKFFNLKYVSRED